jgi:hypothetical protein
MDLAWPEGYIPVTRGGQEFLLPGFSPQQARLADAISVIAAVEIFQ